MLGIAEPLPLIAFADPLIDTSEHSRWRAPNRLFRARRRLGCARYTVVRDSQRDGRRIWAVSSHHAEIQTAAQSRGAASTDGRDSGAKPGVAKLAVPPLIARVLLPHTVRGAAAVVLCMAAEWTPPDSKHTQETPRLVF